MVASSTGCRSVMVCPPEKAKAGYPVLHSGCLEGIVSGNRNSNTHGKKEEENAPWFPGYPLKQEVGIDSECGQDTWLNSSWGEPFDYSFIHLP